EHRDRLVASVDAVRLGKRPAFDVHVDTRYVVGGDQLLVRGGDRVDVGARVADLGAALVGAPSTERRDDVAARGAKAGDVGEVAAGGDRLALHAVPREGARALARRLEEG